MAEAELIMKCRCNALFNAHCDDSEFGYLSIIDEVCEAGEPMADRIAWRICSELGWWSVFGKKLGRNGKIPGPQVHNDLCAVLYEHGVIRHEFTATVINEHWTAEGNLYLCVIKDLFPNRVVGYSIDSRIWSSIAVNALNSAVAWRSAVAGCVLHTDQGSRFRSRRLVHALNCHTWPSREDL